MIAIRCPHCGQPLQVKDEFAGKNVKCPNCSRVMATPPPGAAPFAQPQSEAPTWPPPSPPAPAGEQSQGGTVAYQSRSENGAGTAPVNLLAPPQAPGELGRLGPYRVLKVLGHGGMGIVFQAEDPQLKRLVALKAMLPHLAANPTARQRFLHEAQAAARLEHDHVISIHQVGEDRGVPYLAMPFLRGEPLEDRLRREGKLPIAEVLRIGRETALGLAAAHAHGLIHRDVKPGNIWLEAGRRRVKILDFGLVRQLDSDLHLTHPGAAGEGPRAATPLGRGGGQRPGGPGGGADRSACPGPGFPEGASEIARDSGGGCRINSQAAAPADRRRPGRRRLAGGRSARPPRSRQDASAGRAGRRCAARGVVRPAAHRDAPGAGAGPAARGAELDH
jgi:ribosomal protein S27E